MKVAPIKPKTFLQKNWFLLVVIVYLFVPIDFIPDELPLIGNLDDTLLLIAELIRRYANFYGKEKE